MSSTNRDYDKWCKIASGVQAAVIALAVLIGGAWTLYTFSSLRQVDRARLQLATEQRALRERGILEIAISTSQLAHPEGAHRYILATVSVKNTGNRTEVVDWGTSGLWVTRVAAADDGQAVHGQPVRYQYLVPGEEAIKSSFLPGQTRQLPFLVALSAGGVYHLLFKAEVSPLERDIHVAEHGLNDVAYAWQSSTYVALQ
jgi:hypothetical protein